MRFPRAVATPLLREFWRGLTTPDPAALKIAAVIFLILLGVLSALAANFRQRVEAGEVSWREMTNDICRSSVLAASGAARETDPSAKTLVFVGPSALRCWLPHPDEADALATSAAGSPVRVLAMCGNKQSYALTSALIDRFGADFDGWFVIGVARQSIAKTAHKDDLDYKGRESRAVGFESEVLRRNSAYLGYPQERATGWELWDRRAFHYQYKLGLNLPFKARESYDPYMPATHIAADPESAGITSLDSTLLERRLVILEQVVGNVRAQGRARVALVEIPWVDTFTPSMQTPAWRRDEAAYQQTMRDWSQRNDVPWLTAAAGFHASIADFSDPRHIGSPLLRRQFLEAVARELAAP